MKRKLLSLVLIVTLMSTILAGCGSKDKVEEEGLKVGLVLAGGLGDRSFYDSANEGVERAKAELGVKTQVYECKNDATLMKDQLVQASENSNVVAVVGHEFYDAIQEVAGAFKDVQYIYVDSDIEGIENMITVSYADNEGSFLAGALAALMTTNTEIEGMNPEKSIGMIGGKDIAIIRNFQVGYEAGAKYIDKDIKVETMFTEDFEDPAKGKEAATVLYSKGVDIIFPVAGKTGEGVYEAAEEFKQFAIGVDSDQRHINPDRIMASMIKKVGQSIYDNIENIQKGEKLGGKVQVYNLAKDGVGLSYGPEDMEQIVPEDIKAKVEAIREDVLAGKIQIPSVTE